MLLPLLRPDVYEGTALHDGVWRAEDKEADKLGGPEVPFTEVSAEVSAV